MTSNKQISLEDRRKVIVSDMKQLSDNFKDFKDLSDNHSKFITYKQGLIAERTTLANKFDANRRSIKIIWYASSEYIKSGNDTNPSILSKIPADVIPILDSIKTDGLPMKNQEQRDAVRNVVLSKRLGASDKMDNHINFLNDTIKSCSNMVFTIATAVEMYKIKNGLKL